MVCGDTPVSWSLYSLEEEHLILFACPFICLLFLSPLLFLFIKLFMLLLVALSLHCCTRAFSSCSRWGYFVVVYGLLVRLLLL